MVGGMGAGMMMRNRIIPASAQTPPTPSTTAAPNLLPTPAPTGMMRMMMKSSDRRNLNENAMELIVNQIQEKPENEHLQEFSTQSVRRLMMMKKSSTTAPTTFTSAPAGPGVTPAPTKSMMRMGMRRKNGMGGKSSTAAPVRMLCFSSAQGEIVHFVTSHLYCKLFTPCLYYCLFTVLLLFGSAFFGTNDFVGGAFCDAVKVCSTFRDANRFAIPTTDGDPEVRS